MANPILDWTAICVEYKANQLSIRGIAANHGVSEGAIRYRAKSLGWQRDHLDKKIKRATKEKLLLRTTQNALTHNDPDSHAQKQNMRKSYLVPEVSDPKPTAELIDPGGHVSDEKIIQFASARAVEIIEIHRQDLDLYRGICSMMANELRMLTENSMDIEAFLDAVETQDNAKAVDMLRKGLGLSERAKVVNHLVQSLVRLVEAERKVYNIDEDDGDSDKPSMIILETRVEVGVMPKEET
jgi:hypothetical protein